MNTVDEYISLFYISYEISYCFDIWHNCKTRAALPPPPYNKRILEPTVQNMLIFVIQDKVAVICVTLIQYVCIYLDKILSMPNC